MKRLSLLGLCAVTGVLLALAWPAIGTLGPLLLIALVPMLYVEDQVADRNYKRLFWYAYFCFFVFNALTTWWIYCVNEPMGTKLFSVGAPVLLNPIFMATVWQLFHVSKKHLGRRSGYAALIIYWMAFEYVHLRWELSWPWLTLGNGFADSTSLIQWYEYTGATGGTFWILLTNILVYHIVRHFTIDRKPRREANILIGGLVVLVGLPIGISLGIKSSYVEAENPVTIVAVQPNIDPYTEKYRMSGAEQLEKMFGLAAEAGTPETDCFIFPETALPANLYESDIDKHPAVGEMKSFLSSYPNATMLMGMSSVKRFYSEVEAPETARLNERDGVWRDFYNSALWIEKDRSTEVYHKSKLVLAVETMPFGTLLKALDGLSLDYGGTTGSLGTQETRSVFGAEGDPQLAPVICYESIYGQFVGDYVLNGADAICIITNDAWWDETPGHRQHLSLARLRAIEHRRSIARSANTGISCFIDQLGNVTQATNYNEPAAISGTINRNTELTFYTRWGDFLARSAAFFSVLLLIWTFVRKRANKNSLTGVSQKP